MLGRRVRRYPSAVARVLVIDNYDSFVYNLVQYLGQLGAEPWCTATTPLTYPRSRGSSRTGSSYRLARAARTLPG